MLEGKGKPAGGGRWFVKFKQGDDLFRLTQRWHRLSRVIDRRRNR